MNKLYKFHATGMDPYGSWTHMCFSLGPMGFMEAPEIDVRTPEIDVRTPEFD
jgi:hypothetical protein